MTIKKKDKRFHREKEREKERKKIFVVEDRSRKDG